MFAFFGGGNSIPGVSSDNQTPGGEIIAGALQAGDPNAAVVPTSNVINGATELRDSLGNVIAQIPNLSIVQTQPQDGLGGANALFVRRAGDISSGDYQTAVMFVVDATASANPLFMTFKGGIFPFIIDGDGVRIHNKLKTGASVTHTLGAYSGKAVPIYDESGTLLGYMPLYA